MIVRRKTARAAGVLLLAVSAVAGCTQSDGPAGGHGVRGAHVRVLGVWSGPEYDSFAAVTSRWEKDSGATVDWEGTQNLPAVLDARLRDGKAPDIAILPNPGLLHQLAARGSLVPLDSVLDMEQIRKDYPSAWTDLGRHRGKLYGIFYKLTDKATVWYSPRAFAAGHYSVPTTWTALLRLADRMVADRHTPFSIVAASGPANGWALTDWISELVLNRCGPDVFDRWVAAELPWTSACVRSSFELFDRLVRTKGYVLGGPDRIVSTTDAAAADPLYTNPPSAYLCYLASFAQGFIAANSPDLTPGRDYGFFPFPTVDPRYRDAIAVGGDVIVMTHDTPAARAFLSYLAGARAQEAWIELGGFTSVNRSVPLSAYPDPVARAVARHLTGARVIRFSAGDMMPAAVQRAWWAAMLELVRHPERLPSILDALTRAARSAR